MENFEALMARGGSAAIQQAAGFFMHHDPVHIALHGITSRLKALGIPHAVAGGMAVVGHGRRQRPAQDRRHDRIRVRRGFDHDLLIELVQTLERMP